MICINDKINKIANQELTGLIRLLLGVNLISLLGRWFWFFDLFSHFVWQYLWLAVFVLLFSFYINKKTYVFFAFVLLLFNFLLVFPYYIKNSATNNGDENLSVLQFNMYYKNQELDKIYNWIINNDVVFDVIQFQEITPKQKSLLNKLKEKYPYQFMVLEKGNFGFALLSRYELVNTNFNNIPQHRNKYWTATIKFYNKKIKWFGLHATPPATKDYWLSNTKELEYVADIVKKDKNQYKLLAGDFNITPYNYRFKKLLKNSTLGNAMKGFGIKNSWSIRGIPLPKIFGLAIDHILVSSNIKTINYDVGDFLFSDHRPIFAEVVFTP